MAREEALTDSLTNNTLPPLPRPPERLQPQSQSQAAFQRLSRSNFSAGQEVIDAMDRELEPLEFLDEDMPMAHEFNETLAELDDQGAPSTHILFRRLCMTYFDLKQFSLQLNRIYQIL